MTAWESFNALFRYFETGDASGFDDPPPQKPHGEIVKVKMNNYDDIAVYEDGYEESVYHYID